MAHGFAVSMLVFAILLGGCAGPLGSSIREYDHGRYPQALDNLRRAEIEAASLCHRERVRYALYRGLTHLALGDRSASWRWLAEAKGALDAEPLVLSDEDAGRLESAFHHMPRER
jgi:hypothetical protein